MIDEMRRNGEIVEREDGCEVGGIASVVARNVVLMQREGNGELQEVGRVALA